MAEARKGPGFLTGEAFEKLLTKASQPIHHGGQVRQEQPSQAVEETSEYHQTGD